MWSKKSLAVVVLFSIALFAASGNPVAADDEGGGDRGKKIVDVLKEVKVGLADAVRTAETKTKGRAVAAELEAEDDGIAWEVVCVVVDGETVKFVETEVDAKTGSIIEDDDDEGEGDDEDGDDEGGEDEGKGD
jgi:uncharacterized membrane protein YkoI